MYYLIFNDGRDYDNKPYMCLLSNAGDSATTIFYNKDDVMWMTKNWKDVHLFDYQGDTEYDKTVGGTVVHAIDDDSEIIQAAIEYIFERFYG